MIPPYQLPSELEELLGAAHEDELGAAYVVGAALLVDGGGTHVLEGVSLVLLVVGATQVDVEVDQTEEEVLVDQVEDEVDVDQVEDEMVVGPGTSFGSPYQVVV